jgi:cytochrome c553
VKVSRILLVSIMIGLLPWPSFAQKGDVSAGKATFAKRCAPCHGAAGEGKQEIAKTLKVELRHLGSKEVQAISDADFQKTIREGKGKMKPVKDLTDQDLLNLTAYFRTLAQK